MCFLVAARAALGDVGGLAGWQVGAHARTRCPRARVLCCRTAREEERASLRVVFLAFFFCPLGITRARTHARTQTHTHTHHVKIMRYTLIVSACQMAPDIHQRLGIKLSERTLAEASDSLLSLSLSLPLPLILRPWA